MEKTLGGDRLGSGKKMKVHLHNYERSTFDLGYVVRTTMSAGTLVPFISELALPGDTFDINLDCDVKTLPTIGPLFGSYKVQLDVFQAPVRLYNANLHNNELNIGRNMSAIKLPKIEFYVGAIGSTVENIDNAQVNPSCILSHFGYRGFGITSTTQTRRFNAIPILAYWEIYKNYYANKQEEIGAVIHTPAITPNQTVDPPIEITTDGITETLPTGSSGTVDINGSSTIEINWTGTAPTGIMILTDNGWQTLESLFNVVAGNPITGAYIGSEPLTAFQWRYRTATDNQLLPPAVVTFDLANIDQMRKNILRETDPQFVVNDSNLEPYKWLYEQPGNVANILSSQEGLGLKTYQSDLFNNWLSTEWIDGAGGITEVTSIDTTGGSFSLDTLNLSKKVYNMLNRIAVSGGTYDDWLDAVWAHDRYQRAESPIYCGGLIKELVFQEVVSNSESADQPLGTLAGKGILAKKHKGGQIRISVDEPSWIIGIVSLTPRIDYSQGNKWNINLDTMDDFHKPALDEIGFQELITEQMAWWTTEYSGGQWVQKSAGKQPAWINYMTNVNTTRGNFAVETNQMFMTLNRRYERSGDEIADLTTYIDPSKFNFIFAETALDAQNFWTQIAVDMTARRKMSSKVMPNL
ncbi:MAG: major capsid protein [Microviridae sp.]|nr:MAG: major capsid protein [Microviridae sp.]